MTTTFVKRRQETPRMVLVVDRCLAEFLLVVMGHKTGPEAQELDPAAKTQALYPKLLRRIRRCFIQWAARFCHLKIIVSMYKRLTRWNNQESRGKGVQWVRGPDGCSLRLAYIQERGRHSMPEETEIRPLLFLKFYSSHETLLTALDDEERGRLLGAIMAYAFHQEELHPEGNERYVWPAFKNYIDSCYVVAEQNRKNGAKGGQTKSTSKRTIAEASNLEPSQPDQSLYISKD